MFGVVCGVSLVGDVVTLSVDTGGRTDLLLTGRHSQSRLVPTNRRIITTTDQHSNLSPPGVHWKVALLSLFNPVFPSQTPLHFSLLYNDRKRERRETRQDD